MKMKFPEVYNNQNEKKKESKCKVKCRQMCRGRKRKVHENTRTQCNYKEVVLKYSLMFAMQLKRWYGAYQEHCYIYGNP